MPHHPFRVQGAKRCARKIEAPAALLVLLLIAGPAGTALFIYLLAFRLWPAVRCALGHGLRFAPGPRARNILRGSLALARRILRPDLALRGPNAGPNLQCQKANKNGPQRPLPKGTAMTNTTQHGDNASQLAPKGTLEHLDPTMLALEVNVRDDSALDPDFLASVKEHGVINPIIAVRGDDAVVRVRAGQRRTLAAREAGLPTVPVYVRTHTSGDEQTQVVERLTEQIVENDQRLALTAAQRARGIQQMLDAGMSVTKAAKRLSISRDTVRSAAKAGESASVRRIRWPPCCPSR